ncbi:MAG: hypothetical protein NTY12_01865 [Candidatus Falkowbacteria bacterium]|nr:hypothetical protein [Candidatus Falkowbacteria bacterium]
MPNHVHGIIVINKNNTLGSHKREVETRHGNDNVNKNNNVWVETRHGASLLGNHPPRRNNELVETHNYASLQNARPLYNGNVFGPQSKNLASIIRSYKIAVKTYANKNNVPFVWQTRYYDHVIWNERELNNIREYILNNPYNWERDRNNLS